MAAQGVLVQPSSGGSEVWDVTWQKLDRALPRLRSEVFPGEAKNSKDYNKTAETEKKVPAEQ